MIEALTEQIDKYSFVLSLALVGVVMLLSKGISARLTADRIHASAIAITLGLVAAAIAGFCVEGKKGVADLPLMGGMAIVGGAAFRDLAIVATAFGVRLQEFLALGFRGIASLLIGVTYSFLVGGLVAYGFGYRDPVDVTTIGAGAATYIVGPVTGEALGAGADVIAISVAVGLVKSVLCMIVTPLVASRIGLNNPRSALIFGGLMGTTSGVAAGLAATDPKLAPYGAMTATFYTGLGCLLGPSLMYGIISLMIGT